MKYFKVKAKGGHVGTGNMVELIFYIEAPTMLDAMQKCRRMPGVKHNKRNAILKAEEITQEEYLDKIKNYSAYDIYNNREVIK